MWAPREDTHTLYIIKYYININVYSAIIFHSWEKEKKMIHAYTRGNNVCLIIIIVCLFFRVFTFSFLCIKEWKEIKGEDNDRKSAWDDDAGERKEEKENERKKEEYYFVYLRE